MPLDHGLILIIARNNVHLTKLTFNSALLQEFPCHVWVLDNASNDSTHNWLRTKTQSRVHWWTYMIQRSLASCWNEGLRRAFAAGYDRVLVLNNDVEIRRDTYQWLQEWQIQHRIPFTTAVSVNSKSELAEGRHPSTSSPHPDFSCFMISQHCWDVTGEFDDSFYPAYCEDNDYHVRMHRAGIEAVSIDLPYLHHGASTIKNADPVEQAMIRRGHDTNKDRFKAKYGCYPTDAQYAQLFRSPANRRPLRKALINQA